MSSNILQSSEYIAPILRIYTSYEEAQKDHDNYLLYGDYFANDRGSNLQIVDLLNFKRIFVIAEPGYGKTRLLQELVKQASKFGKKGILLDIKKINNRTIEQFISEETQSEKESKTHNFQLSNNYYFVCIDAIDEIRQDQFSNTVNEINNFSQRYTNIILIFSCRWHYFHKYYELFDDLKPSYAHIRPFSKAQVETYLENNNLKQTEIDKIFRILTFHNRNLVIQTPRYLELLVDYIKNKGIDHLKVISKTGLFEYFIYKKLEIEDERLNTQKREFIKRVLEKLALIMEIYQTNLISKDELFTFFDDLNSDIKVNLLNQIPIEIFYDKTLLKDNIDTIEFDNTEFQEYLAAKEITRLGNVSQVVYDLAINKELKTIYPSWFNTLQCVVDLEITLLKPLLEYSDWCSQYKYISEEYHRFLTNIDVQRLVLSERKVIFKKVFEYYQYILHWIDEDIAANLAYYFDISEEPLLKAYVQKRNFKSDEERFVQLGNIASIVGKLIEIEIFNEKQIEYWKQKLINFAKDTNKNGVLQRRALSALAYFNDISVLEKIESVWNSEDDSVKDGFLLLCRKLKPESHFSLKHFIAGIKLELIPATYGLLEIKSKEGIINLLDAFITDQQFLDIFIDRESIFKDYIKIIIGNIEAVLDEEIYQEVLSILEKAFESERYYNAEHSTFIQSLAMLAKEYKKDYLFDLIEKISNNAKPKLNLFYYNEIFALTIEDTQVDNFIKVLSKLNDKGRGIALYVLQRVKFLNRPSSIKIYEKGREYFKKEYKIAENNWTQQKKKPNPESKIYEELKYKLQPVPGKYNPGVFNFFVNHKDELNKIITTEDKNRLVSLIENSILDKFDPGQQKLKLEISSGGTKYTTHSWISIFGDAIEALKELNIPLKDKYRKKVINYIPFAYHNHQEAIFFLVKDIKKAELVPLLRIYKQRSSDLWRFMPSSLIRTAEQYNLDEMTPILKEFVSQKRFQLFDRKEALRVAMFLNPDDRYLKAVFDRYKNSNNYKIISDKANELLIAIFKDKKAIKWRFGELANRAFKFKMPKGVHWVGDEEDEMSLKHFAKPIMLLKDIHYKEEFFKLLDNSFRLLKEDETQYNDYAKYLWEIVSIFIDNLKEGKSYQPIILLEKYVTQHLTEKGINWFGYKLKDLKEVYLRYIGKPTDIAECIKNYNKLKIEQYQEITRVEHLFEFSKEILKNEFTRWCCNEGRKLLEEEDEKKIQKILQIELENLFLKKGFRKNEISILREPQLLSDKRTDFIITYGFIGSIIIEVKLSHSPDLKGNNLSSKASYESMKHYMCSYKAPYGIFLVVNNKIKVTDRYNWESYMQKISKVYQNIPGVEVLGVSITI